MTEYQANQWLAGHNEQALQDALRAVRARPLPVMAEIAKRNPIKPSLWARIKGLFA
jgi:hypothetical protein